jgi:non-ribosomal peptide synthetase component F
VLHRHTGEDDVVVGSMMANRSVQTARVVGCFVNPVAIRTNFEDDPAFTELVGRVHRTVNATSRRAAYPFQKVADELRLGGVGRPHQPYFQAMFSWHRTTHVIDRALSASTALGAAAVRSSVNGLRIAPIPIAERAAPNDVTLRAGEMGDELIATFEYNVELFEAATIARMASHLERILGSVHVTVFVA